MRFHGRFPACFEGPFTPDSLVFLPRHSGPRLSDSGPALRKDPRRSADLFVLPEAKTPGRGQQLAGAPHTDWPATAMAGAWPRHRLRFLSGAGRHEMLNEINRRQVQNPVWLGLDLLDHWKN